MEEKRESEAWLPRIHHNQQYEQELLGALLIGNRESDEVCGALAPEHFFFRNNRTIYSAILKLRELHKSVDFLAVVDLLETSGEIEEAGGSAYVCTLGGIMPRVASVKGYADSLRRYHRLNKYRSFVEAASAMLQNTSVNEEQFLGVLQEHVADFAMERESDADMGTTVRDAGVDLLSHLDKQKQQRIITGVAGVEENTGGMLPGELVVVTADTGVGKTLFAQQCRRLACARAMHTLYCSGEMLARHLTAREVASKTRVSPLKMRTAEKLTEQEKFAIFEAVNHLCEKCRILDQELTLARIRSVARKMKRLSGLELVVIDYDELVEVPGNDEWEQQKNLARAAKSIATELECVVILISQLRKPLQGEDRAHPRLHSLYGSAAKSKHASIVLYVDREWVRELAGDETAARICVLKSRDGRLGAVECKFNVRSLAFEDLPTTKADDRRLKLAGGFDREAI